MKPFLFLSIPTLALALPLAVGPALANDDAKGNTGGFTGPDTVQLTSVADALGLPDESRVKLQGYILRSLGDEKYEFRDNSGTVTVEIDSDDWRGVEATPELKVELLVEVDQDWRKTELDVESVRLVP
jgi:uncharacterized protein (TIGR00156 family)